MLKFPNKSNFLFHHPLPNRSRLRRETATDFDNFTTVRSILTSIAFFFNLLQGFICRAIQFKFKNVDVFVRFDDAVYSALGLAFFCVNNKSAY